MDALIFDYDGVVLDSEPYHYEGFQQILKQFDITIPADIYADRYLGLTDFEGFRKIFNDYNRTDQLDNIEDLVQKKTAIVQNLIRNHATAIPGTVELVKSAVDSKIPIAICSGALRDEVKIGAETLGILEHFPVIVSAEDVSQGKTDPEGYIKTCRLLSEKVGKKISPNRCVVCEDSPAGTAAANSAGMRVCGLATSYAKHELPLADIVVENLSEISISQLARLIESASSEPKTADS